MAHDKVCIIAEIGECFNGDMGVAKQLINEAMAAGCDYAKFQTLDIEGIADDDPEKEWFESVALDKDKLKELKEYCEAVGVGFLCTPEKLNNAVDLKELGCTAVKIASSCILDHELIDYVAANFPVVFVSTGLASLDEVRAIMDKLAGLETVYLMHCISEYPTGPLLDERGLTALAPGDVRLPMMDILAREFPQAVIGYSDHTVTISAPVAAVARGAMVVEKHFTLDRETPVAIFENNTGYQGTDHILSLTPPEMKEMVKQIREVEQMITPTQWDRTDGEKLLMTFLRGRFAN